MSRPPWLVGACLVLLAGSLATAQPEGNRSGQLMFGLRGLMGRGALTDEWANLLRSEQVRQELGIAAEQLDKLKGISQKAKERVKASFAEVQRLRDASPEKRKAEFAEWAKKARAQAEETKEEIEGVLRPPQIVRLTQIALQVRGAAALQDKQIQVELKLTDEQKKQLRSLREGPVDGFRGGVRSASDEERKARREKLEALRKQSEAKALGILTAEQKARFEEMKGPKSDLDILQTRPRGPRTP